MALQEGAVQDELIVHILLQEEEENDFYLATRQAEFFQPTKDTRDPVWFFMTNDSTLWMQDEEVEFFASRDSSLSFPTPKLGAKTRPC